MEKSKSQNKIKNLDSFHRNKKINDLNNNNKALMKDIKNMNKTLNNNKISRDIIKEEDSRNRSNSNKKKKNLSITFKQSDVDFNKINSVENNTSGRESVEINADKNDNDNNNGFYLTSVNTKKFSRQKSVRSENSIKDAKLLIDTKNEFIDYILHDNTKVANLEELQQEIISVYRVKKEKYDLVAKETELKRKGLSDIDNRIKNELMQLKKFSYQNVIDNFNHQIELLRKQYELKNTDYHSTLKTYGMVKDDKVVIKNNLEDTFKQVKRINETHKKFQILSHNIITILNNEESVLNNFKNFEGMTSINNIAHLEKRKEVFNNLDFKLYIAKNLTKDGEKALEYYKIKIGEENKKNRRLDRLIQFKYNEQKELIKTIIKENLNDQKLKKKLNVTDMMKVVEVYKNNLHLTQKYQTTFNSLNKEIFDLNTEHEKLVILRTRKLNEKKEENILKDLENKKSISKKLKELEEDVLESEESIKLLKLKKDEYCSQNIVLSDHIVKLQEKLKHLIIFVHEGMSKLVEVKSIIEDSNHISSNNSNELSGKSKSEKLMSNNSIIHIKNQMIIKQSGKKKGFKLDDFITLLHGFHSFSHEIIYIDNLIKLNIQIIIQKEENQLNNINADLGIVTNNPNNENHENQENYNLFQIQIKNYKNKDVEDRFFRMLEEKNIENEHKRKFLGRSQEEILKLSLLEKSAKKVDNNNLKQYVSSNNLANQFIEYMQTSKGKFIHPNTINVKFIREMAKLTNQIVKFDHHNYNKNNCVNNRLNELPDLKNKKNKSISEKIDEYTSKSLAKRFNKFENSVSDSLFRDIQRESMLNKVISIKLDRKRKELEYDILLKNRTEKARLKKLSYDDLGMFTSYNNKMDKKSFNKTQLNLGAPKTVLDKDDDDSLIIDEKKDDYNEVNIINKKIDRLNKNASCGDEHFIRAAKLQTLDIKFNNILRTKKNINLNEFQVKYNNTKRM